MSKKKLTTFRSAIAVSSGDKTFSRFQKGRLPLLKRNVQRLSNRPHTESAFAESLWGTELHPKGEFLKERALTVWVL